MSSSAFTPSPVRCPRCANPATAGAPHCRVCGVSLSGSRVGELRWIDEELARVDQARTWLVNRRMTLLAELARQRTATVVGPSPGPAVAEIAAAIPAPAEPKAARPELSGRAVARILLVVGALLVVIAAAVFTVANWSSIGTFGRCAVLLGATVIVLVTPKLLTRRDLVATAEAVAGVGLALTLADAYLISHLLNLPGHGLMTAAGYAAIAAVWVGYGWSTRLRVPVVAGIGMAQLPALFVTADLAGRSSAGPLALVLVLMAGADLMLARALAGEASGRDAGQFDSGWTRLDYRHRLGCAAGGGSARTLALAGDGLHRGGRYRNRLGAEEPGGIGDRNFVRGTA